MEILELSILRHATLREALAQLDRTAQGVILLNDESGRFERTITDGDLRRMMLQGASLDDQLAELAHAESVTLAPGFTRRQALEKMQKHGINQVPVVDASGRAVDLVLRAEIDEQILLSTPHMGSAELDFVGEAFRTNWIAPLGPNVDAFEGEMADAVGASHAVALSSGTAAIHIALILLGVGHGDAVFCSSLTFAASVNPIVYQGAEPVLIDSEPDSWNMSPVALERALAAATRANRLPKAVIIVSLYGQSADMDPLLELCDHYGVPVIEDAAESLGATYKGKSSGTFGKLGIYSFNGNKIITTSGGGLLVTEDKALADRARFLATQARDPAPHYEHTVIGYNYRMSNILAGVGRGQLRVLGERVAARRAVFDLYKSELSDLGWLEWMPEPEWSVSTHWLSVCTIAKDCARISNSDVIAALAADLIEARPVWKPMHMQPVFSACDYYEHGNASVSDDLFARGICLPSGSNMTEGQVLRVIERLRAYSRLC
ncbi:aminotransferase class I/II-fold pyridoxal phosphate-dependent enzyme [Devosia sp. BSSL-BM10]|uniref:GDP-perosamine synthase n=1 Tax=Devosia litorisediminis TaxID=2829817 RepID=A0A942IEL1_9HYPH|nr:aminotransferase class I/II-fold pyridoxal phosphate-dependent enzyme [Devosia litorisediminis]MBS3849804.1 aminotransferase class I/II-fold pyridoxal phosphate-dependent enzyme [Devosia litorisediminis]